MRRESHLQAMVNDFYGQFVKGVAQFRNDTQQNVRNGYGEGRTLTAVKSHARESCRSSRNLGRSLSVAGRGRPSRVWAARRKVAGNRGTRKPPT